MLGLFRLAGILLIALTAIYVCLLFYFRAGQRAHLERAWERDRPPLPRHTYVENGLRDRRGHLQRNLILGVYVAPIAILCIVIYVTNYA
jgi:hypothetical protein